MTPSAGAEHAHRDVQGLEHALGIGDALPGPVERGAVVHRHAEERQPDRHVDAGEAGPGAALLVVVEAERLHRHVPLVVVHRDHDVELAPAGAGEDRVGGQGTVHVEPGPPRVLDGRDDPGLLLVAEEAVLARVRIEPAHRNTGPRAAQAGHGLLGQVDDAADALAGDQVRHAAQRHVGGDVDDPQLLAHQEHREILRVGEPGQDLGVPGVLHARGGERFLVDRRGDDAVDRAGLTEPHAGLDVGVGGAAGLGADRGLRQGGRIHVGQVEALDCARLEAACVDGFDRVQPKRRPEQRQGRLHDRPVADDHRLARRRDLGPPQRLGDDLRADPGGVAHGDAEHGNASGGHEVAPRRASNTVERNPPALVSSEISRPPRRTRRPRASPSAGAPTRSKRRGPSARISA